jgi:hypothetical protein
LPVRSLALHVSLRLLGALGAAGLLPVVVGTGALADLAGAPHGGLAPPAALDGGARAACSDLAAPVGGGAGLDGGRELPAGDAVTRIHRGLPVALAHALGGDAPATLGL